MIDPAQPHGFGQRPSGNASGQVLPSVEKIDIVLRKVQGTGASPQAGDAAGSLSPMSQSWLRLPVLLAATTNVPAAVQFDDVLSGGQTLVFQSSHGAQGPVTGIAIAPDSPIQSVDLVFGTGSKERFRISPQCPYFGNVPADKCLVVPIRDITDLGAYASGAEKRVISYWDAAYASDLTHDVQMPAWRVRLHVYRGPLPPVYQFRAPQFATLIFSTDPANGVSVANDDAQFVVCVDGRTRIDFLLTQTGGASVAGALVDINGIESFPGSGFSIGSGVLIGSPGFRGSAQASTQQRFVPVPLLVGASFPPAPVTMAKSYQGNPFQFVIVRVYGTQATEGIVQVNAWDY